MLNNVAAPNRGDVSAVNDSSAALGNSGERILVLESDETIASSIVQGLHEAAPAAMIDVARSPEDAQRLLGNGRPDLVVLDVDESHIGRNLLLQLRKSQPQARAIVVTGNEVAAARRHDSALGVINFVKKPIVGSDFVDLAQALLGARGNGKTTEMQTLRDLQVGDVVQLECISGATAALEVTGRTGKKGRVYFEQGQVRHARALGKEGVEAFKQIVGWKISNVSELSEPTPPKTTIGSDWRSLLLELTSQKETAGAERVQRPTILVIDDSPMLLNFVEELLRAANCDVVIAGSGQEGLQLSSENPPDLILLDYLLPDIRGDEVSRRLAANNSTARVPVLYMSGFGGDLENARAALPNVVGVVNKPFTPEMLLEQLREHLPNMNPEESEEAAEPPQPTEREEAAVRAEFTNAIGAEPAVTDAPLWNTNAEAPPAEARATEIESSQFTSLTEPASVPADGGQAPADMPFFSGDTNFFSLTWALRTIVNEKLTGVLHCFANGNSVELYARNGQILLVSTREAQLYCAEAPTSLANVDGEQLESARAVQHESGCPLFITLLRRELIPREAALQLLQHHSQRLFAQLWSTARVRFAFEQTETLPDFTNEVDPEHDTDHWILETLRLVQYADMADKLNYDPDWIPAYTRDGFERVQKLRLNVAEAQFASQFNGTRSLAQIARNLRLDLKTARLVLFRFLGSQIVECWPPPPKEKSERGGMFRRLVRRSAD